MLLNKIKQRQSELESFQRSVLRGQLVFPHSFFFFLQSPSTQQNELLDIIKTVRMDILGHFGVPVKTVVLLSEKSIKVDFYSFKRTWEHSDKTQNPTNYKQTIF